ncbi:protease SohB [Saccharobesus litoralis]|uniref:Protease SohB n=1 Tax=Saccharobesus litoralis TaxID=2172099 RepID=A0A2S0VT99_9ALTE|nr:protease SohB [Saccharobesus litoralis]AWB67431.1 protease SohB [Saccharobesus litoralis]
MDFLYEYGLFLAKAVTWVAAIVIVLGAIAANAMKGKGGKKGELELTNLSEHFAEVKRNIKAELLSKEEFKALEKAEKEAEKKRAKAAKQAAKKAKDSQDDSPKESDQKGKIYVVDFKGSMDAHEAESLREEVSAILAVANKQDEVVVRLESPGGVVHGYGLASSQLARFRQKEIPLTVAVDKVAASGGYMMACVANKILSAPFAIIGSIGVLAQIPNFHRLLKKNNIDFEQLTAGEFKRTLTLFGENTDAGRDKFKQELEETHTLFKQHINDFRPALDIDKVATGEHWYGSQAKDLGLIDDVQTSDDYLLEQYETKDVFQVKYVQKKSLSDKLPIGAAKMADAIFVKAWQRLQSLKQQ